MSKELFDKYGFLIAFGVSFGFGLLFTLTPIWQLGLIAGFAGGFLVLKMKWGTLGGLGVAVAWLVYALFQIGTTQAWLVLDQVGGAIVGSGGFGGVVLLWIILLGGLLGALGGAIGSGVRILFNHKGKRE